MKKELLQMNSAFDFPALCAGLWVFCMCATTWKKANKPSHFLWISNGADGPWWERLHKKLLQAASLFKSFVYYFLLSQIELSSHSCCILILLLFRFCSRKCCCTRFIQMSKSHRETRMQQHKYNNSPIIVSLIPLPYVQGVLRTEKK